VQFAILGLLATIYESTSMPVGVVQFEELETVILGIYGVFSVVRLVLAHLRLLRPWMLYAHSRFLIQSKASS